MTFHVYLLAFSILEISTHSLNSTPDIVIVREPEITLHCANDFHRLSPITEWFLTAKWSTIDIQGLESLTWSQNTSVDYQDLDISMKAGPHATNFTECLEISTLNENQDMKLKFLPIADCMVFLESPSDLHLTATCVQKSSQNLSSIQAFDLQLNSDFLFNWESLLSPAEVPYFPWQWWQGTDIQKRRYLRAQKRAYGFIFGMITPLGILFYIAIYLTCCRSSVDQNANMFGSENL